MKKSELRKLIREVIKKQLNEEIVEGIDNINNFCNACDACCNMHDYGGNPVTGFWADVSCGACMNFPVGTIFGPDGSVMGNINVAPMKDIGKGTPINPNQSSSTPPKFPSKKPMFPRKRMEEEKELLNEVETMDCTFGNMGACKRFVNDCIGEGGYIQTNPSDNVDSITIWCVGGGGAPVEDDPTGDDDNVLSFKDVRDFDDSLQLGILGNIGKARRKDFKGSTFKKPPSVS